MTFFDPFDDPELARSGFKIVQSLRARTKDVELFHSDANRSFDGPCLGIFFALLFVQLMTECSFKPKVRSKLKLASLVPMMS